jgi:hypothetical protein
MNEETKAGCLEEDVIGSLRAGAVVHWRKSMNCHRPDAV